MKLEKEILVSHMCMYVSNEKEEEEKTGVRLVQSIAERSPSLFSRARATDRIYLVLSLLGYLALSYCYITPIKKSKAYEI